MKVVILDASESMIEERRHAGSDRRDEMWEGVYHMVPPPNEEHQVIVDGLFVHLSVYFAKHKLGVLRTIKGVREAGNPKLNYRVPEWIAIRAGREGMLKKRSSYVDDGPDVVLEVRSPGDETDEKLPFYERVGVREVLIIDPETRHVELYRLRSGKLKTVSAAADGWIHCEGLHAQFKRSAKSKGSSALLIRLELDGVEHAV